MVNESFIRWQERTINQMGNAINALLIIATTSLGFVVTLLLNNDIYCSPRCLLLVGCFTLLISIFSLLYLIINRTRDFYLTAQIARKREKNRRETIELDRKKSKKLGKLTWHLFYFAIMSLGLGELLIIIGLIVYSLK